jgi:hypothetical protein
MLNWEVSLLGFSLESLMEGRCMPLNLLFCCNSDIKWVVNWFIGYYIIMETLLMGRRCCYVLCFIFIYYSQQSSCATIKVGGPVGWTNYDTSTNKPPDYATWVSSQSVVDDILGDNQQHRPLFVVWTSFFLYKLTVWMCCCILITLLLKWIVTVFKFPLGYHNVYSLPTQAAYTSCD